MSSAEVRWCIEYRRRPADWGPYRRPFAVRLDGRQISVFETVEEAIAAIPTGETALVIEESGSRRLVTGEGVSYGVNGR